MEKIKNAHEEHSEDVTGDNGCSKCGWDEGKESMLDAFDRVVSQEK